MFQLLSRITRPWPSVQLGVWHAHYCVLLCSVLVWCAAPGISASPSEDNLRYFNVMILGPTSSPYEGESRLGPHLVVGQQLLIATQTPNAVQHSLPGLCVSLTDLESLCIGRWCIQA
jgi:hypothetical protein